MLMKDGRGHTANAAELGQRVLVRSRDEQGEAPARRSLSHTVQEQLQLRAVPPERIASELVGEVGAIGIDLVHIGCRRYGRR